MMNNSDNGTDTEQNKKEKSTNTNIPLPTTIFKLPITFVDADKLHTLNEHILTDLELREDGNVSNETTTTSNGKTDDVPEPECPPPQIKTMYDHLFNPKTIYGKQFLSHWATHYTSDVTFLKQTQIVMKHFSPPPPQSSSSSETSIVDQYNDIHAIWNSIQFDKHFKDKFGYVDIQMLEPLNSSSFFLQILSLQNLASPVISLLTPLIILIIPFILLKIQAVPVSFSSYISSLKRIAQYHPIGKIFDNFSSIPWDKRIYIFISIAFYFIQIYQNIISCRRFYKNMFLIHNNINKFSVYIEHSIRNISYFHSVTKNLSSYKKFSEESAMHAHVLSELYSDIKTVMPFKLTFANIANIGTIMKYYYQLFANDSVKNAISYSFGFNSYFEHLCGLKTLILNKKIAPCTFVNSSKKTYFASSYYAPLMNCNPVKNKVILNKKTTITGPNAAGKTTLIKSTLLNIIFSQQFGYGFYKKAKLSPYHYLHSYLNIPDTSGRDSLFQAESRRCREILSCLLEHDTKRHFCIFDELYSGTNPYEAVASAYGFIKYLNKYNNLDLFLTTHYTNLCELLQNENVQNMHMKIEMSGQDGQIKYLYQLDKGISSIKGGIKVLQDLDYPEDIITSTRDIIKNTH
jgi:hypothetical protein